jgi:acyl-CoA oxidase
LIGDCGPKNGNNQIDNGFMLFDHVRIPFENQLDRISGVS